MLAEKNKPIALSAKKGKAREFECNYYKALQSRKVFHTTISSV